MNMRASFKTHNDGTVAQLDTEAARAVCERRLRSKVPPGVRSAAKVAEKDCEEEMRRNKAQRRGEGSVCQ